MVSRRDNLKRYIKLISKQLPMYFNLYSEEDQKFLEMFVEPLKYCEEADYKRKELAQRFRNARNYFISHKNYLQYPFFWFVESYFENVEVSLRISTFHADTFYDYLLPILRGTAGEEDGVFQLLKNAIPLSDLRWEVLQYKSSKLHIPLKPYELEIIKTVYRQLRSEPLQILKPRRIRSIILNQHDIPRLSSSLPKLFDWLRIRTTVWPQYSAFGIQSFYFYFQINPKNTINDIINFQLKTNGIITTSSVYTIRWANNEYLGVLYLPEGTEKQITQYLGDIKLKGVLLDFILTPIVENRWCYSLSQYQTESGWQELNRSSWKSRVHLMRLTTLPRRRTKIELEYLTPLKEREWNYRELDDPLESINLICKKNIFMYADLLTDIYSSKELKLLKTLIENHSLFIDFFPYRLGAEYSLDLYMMEAPKISFYQLKRLLVLLPSARIADSSNKNYIFAYLTPTMVEQIREDLEWPLYSLLPTHTSAKRTRDMFDADLLKWYQPNILTD